MSKFNMTAVERKKSLSVWGNEPKSHSKESVGKKSFTKRVHMNNIMVKYWSLLTCPRGAYGLYMWKREGRRGKS